MKHKLLLVLALVLSGWAEDKPPNPTPPASLPAAQRHLTRTSPWGGRFVALVRACPPRCQEMACHGPSGG